MTDIFQPMVRSPECQFEPPRLILVPVELEEDKLLEILAHPFLLSFCAHLATPSSPVGQGCQGGT